MRPIHWFSRPRFGFRWKQHRFRKFGTCERCGDFEFSTLSEWKLHEEHGNVVCLWYFEPSPPVWARLRTQWLKVCIVWGCCILGVIIAALLFYIGVV